MKILISVLTVFASHFCNAQGIKEGDNLKTEFNKIAQPYYFAAPGFTDWKEGANYVFYW